MQLLGYALGIVLIRVLRSTFGARVEVSELEIEEEEKTIEVETSQTAEACQDTLGWVNGKNYACSGDKSYETKGWCRDGCVVEHWATGKKINLPEKNCCICGKGGGGERGRNGGQGLWDHDSSSGGRKFAVAPTRRRRGDFHRRRDPHDPDGANLTANITDAEYHRRRFVISSTGEEIVLLQQVSDVNSSIHAHFAAHVDNEKFADRIKGE